MIKNAQLESLKNNYNRNIIELPIARFEDVLLRAVKAIGKMKCEYLLVNYAGVRCKIDVSTIRYFEIHGNHLIRVFYEDKDFAFFSTMEKIEKQLGGRQFCRNHISFMVLLDFIEKLDGNEILMKDGVRIPIGRHYKKKLIALWEEW